jgi:hypothetical protein
LAGAFFFEYAAAMKRRLVPLAAVLCGLGLVSPLAAQAPSPLASPTERLDHLLSTWRGEPVARVREVWGRETATELRGTSPVLVYEKRIKVRPTLGGIVVHSNGGLRCVVRFLISDSEEVVQRVARQGGGSECWNAWRKNEP